MAQRREKEPFIHKGDTVCIDRAGTVSGSWDVMDARWKNRDDAFDRNIELVLGRGGSSRFKIAFNGECMRHYSRWPEDVLSRDISVQKPIQFRPK